LPSGLGSKFQRPNTASLPPPKKHSKKYKADFELLHQWQLQRTERQCEEAAEQAVPSFDAFFGPQRGLLSKKEIKASKPFVERAMKYAEGVAEHYKLLHARPRPYQTDSSLEPCIEGPTGRKSYPSSHATLSHLGACLLAEFYPAKAAALLDAGDCYAELRLIAGVHHPSDIEAGRMLAEQICRRILDESR
jgi:acid phosphatase (class A)